MSNETIAVVGTGNMGHAVGRALRTHGHRVVTALAGRSDHSRELAELAGIEDAGDLTAVMRESDLVLSILHRPRPRILQTRPPTQWRRPKARPRL